MDGLFTLFFYYYSFVYFNIFAFALSLSCFTYNNKKVTQCLYISLASYAFSSAFPSFKTGCLPRTLLSSFHPISICLNQSPLLPSSFSHSPLSLQTYIHVNFNAIIIPEHDYRRIFLGSYTHGTTELSASLLVMITFSCGVAFRSN